MPTGQGNPNTNQTSGTVGRPDNIEQPGSPPPQEVPDDGDHAPAEMPEKAK